MVVTDMTVTGMPMATQFSHLSEGGFFYENNSAKTVQWVENYSVSQ
jgi:hypothetical protein